MRQFNFFTLFVLLFSVLNLPTSEAQLLKKLGQKVEKKVVEKADRKVDRSIDKVLDKADKETDKPLDDALNKPKSSPKEKEAKSKPVAAEAKPKSDGPTGSKKLIQLSAGNCDGYIWFNKGAMMEYTYQGTDGESAHRTKMTVIDIETLESGAIATLEATDDAGTSIEMKYACIDGNLYIDFGAMMKQAMQRAGQQGQLGADEAAVQNALDNTEIIFEDGFMEFPGTMHEGESLKDVIVTIKSSPSPQMTMEITSSLTNRKVEGSESISTPAGTFDCIKISGERSSKMKIMGMNQNMDGGTEYLWFAPNIGVVKQETFDGKNKSQGVYMLTAYKE